MKPNIIFFGTPEYSLLILEKLLKKDYPIVCVVTKPPRPIGRKQIITPTPVALWAKKYNIPCLTPSSHPIKPWLFADEEKISTEVLKYQPQLLISADYTQKIPTSLISQTKFGGLNIHPSLLPKYRGPAPVPWAILQGESETGVSLVTLTEQFDSGTIIAQEKESILATDTTDILLGRLFSKGAELLLDVLPKYVTSPKSHKIISTSQSSYFPRLTRETGFETWETLQKAMEDGTDAIRIDRKYRALHPWPGLWTKVKVNNEEKRLKLLKVHLIPNLPHLPNVPKLALDQIQLEGKQPISGTQISNLLSKISR